MSREDRIRCRSLQNRISTPQEAAAIIRNGMTVGVSGYTPSGYPKVIPRELVKRAEQGEELKLVLFGISVGPEIDEELCRAGIISRRLPFQGNRVLSKAINQGSVSYTEAPIGKVPNQLASGFFGEIDVAVIEVLAVTEKGALIPTSSVGLTPAMLHKAKEVILEVNLTAPPELEGLHDIYLPKPPPGRSPIPLVNVTDRIGKPAIEIDTDKIKHIVFSEVPDTIDHHTATLPEQEGMIDHLLNFLELEIASGRLPKEMLPIQSGIGNLANGIVHGFKKSSFRELDFYCGILQESILELMDAGIVAGASGSALTPTSKVMRQIVKEKNFYHKHLVLRPVEVSNNVEVISRLGVIALNHGIEVDIYGNVNTSHVMGTQVVNGIGGGTEFIQSASLSIVLLPSTGKDKQISTIVPMTSQVDLLEHHVDVLITDRGVADLRGKDPTERATAIIRHCADPMYRGQLQYYRQRAREVHGGHQPHLLEEAFDWHLAYLKKGRMKEWVHRRH